MRGSTRYVLYLFLLTGFDNRKRNLSVLWKKVNTLGGHIWRSTAKLTQESLQVVSNHGNDQLITRSITLAINTNWKHKREYQLSTMNVYSVK